MAFLDHAFSPDFMPHGFCYQWDPLILWLHVVSDSLITLSYYCIPIVLIYFIRKRRDLPFNWIFWMFGGFILACGTTHLMEVWNIWHASYLLSGVIKALTAAISVATAVRLIPLIPHAIAVPNLIHLQETNRKLERKLAMHRRREDALVDVALRRRVTIGLFIAVLVTVFMGLSSWFSARQAADDAAWVSHTRTVRMELSSTIRDVIDVEAGARGFALTDEETFVKPLLSGREDVVQHLQALRQLTADNADQQRRLDRLEPQVRAALESAEQIVSARRRPHPALGAGIIRGNEQWVDTVRATAKAMDDEEMELLEQRSRKAAAARRVTTLVTSAGTLVGLIFLSLAGVAIRRQVDISAHVRSQVSDLNANLERSVDERTAALRESQDRMHGVIQSAMDAIITTDERQRVVMFNAAAEKMFGSSSAQAVGQPIEHFIPQRFRTGHADHVRRFAETGVTSRSMGTLGAVWGLRANGEEFHLEASISQLKAAGRKLFTVILRDVTDRVQTEAKLRASEETLRLLLDGITDYAVYMLDPEGRIATWNAGAARIEGYSSEDVLGQSMSIFYTAEDREKEIPAQVLQEAMARGRVETHGQRVRKDGSTFWAQGVIHPIYDQDGKLRGFSKVLHDISEQKQAEEKLLAQTEELSRQTTALRASEEALRAESHTLQSVLDSMQEGLVVVDAKGKFVIWNRAAESLIGRGPADLPIDEWPQHYGVYALDGVTPFPSDELAIARALRGEIVNLELVIRRPQSPGGICIECAGRPLRDEGGALSGALVVFRDVTARKEAERVICQLNSDLEQRVHERTAQLEAANKELEAFTYSVSHDLRAPLRHVSGFSKMLAEELGDAVPPQAQHYLQRIQEGTRRMGLLVDDLLNLGRVGRQELHLQVVGLASVVQEVVADLQSECEGRQVEWKIGSLPFVECDPGLIKQVFHNLLANALKFSRPRTPAVIEVGREEAEPHPPLSTEPTARESASGRGAPVVFVRDNGVGFSMKYSDKLFGVFQRLHRAEDFEGTGVGLATVQRIIQKHGGRIWAEAELDKGAVFYFTLGVLEKIENKTEAATAGGKQ